MLTEESEDASIFSASLDVSASGAAGALPVAEGDTVTAIYVDADDGAGGTGVEVTAAALVDCTPPQLLAMTLSDLQARSAALAVEADEPVSVTVRYGTACGVLTEEASAYNGTQAVTVSISGLQDDTVYFYAVDLADISGNLFTDDNGGACYSFTTLEQPDYFTEMGAACGLEYTKLLFIPDGSADYYRACSEPAADFPSDPSGGTTLSLSDDDYESVTLSGGAQVSLYGTGYSSFYVGSNGYVTFGSGSTDISESYSNHFSLPRVSGLYDDLYPASNVSWRQLADRVAVTFDGVRQYGTKGETEAKEGAGPDDFTGGLAKDSNSFQIEFFFSGEIHLTFLGIGATDGLTGLSEGLGTPADFVASDLSAYHQCVWDDLSVTPESDMDVSACLGDASACDGYTVGNTGDAALNWQAAADAAWLELSVAGGALDPLATVPVNLCADLTGMTPGIYYTAVTFTNTDTAYEIQIPVTVRLAGAPVEPVNLTPADTSDNVWVEAQLSWEAQSDMADPIVYDVYLGAALDAQELVASGLSAHAFLSQPLESLATYYWHVVARNGCGEAAGPVWTFTTGDCTPEAPINTYPGDGAADVTAFPAFQWTGPVSAAGEAKDNVAVLAFTAYTDTTREYPNTLAALSEYFPGYTLTETAATTEAAFQAALAGMDVFLIPEQEQGSIAQMEAFGTEIHDVLQDFVTAGGVVIACGGAPPQSIQTFLNTTGLMPGMGAGIDVSGQTVDTATSHPLAEGMAASFQAADYALHCSVIPGSAPVVTYDISQYPLAATKIVGNGMVVFLGWDFYSYSDDQARLLANAVHHASLSLSITYNVYLGEDPGALTLIATGLDAGSFAPGAALASETTYYWQVGAENICGESLGPIWSFTTGDFLPGTPGAPSPEDGAADAWVIQNLTWESAADALCGNHYDVYLGTALDALAIVAQDVYSESCATGVLESEQQYYWQVVAKNCTGSVDGPVWSFTTSTCIPDPPVNALPADAATEVAALPVFEWEAPVPASGSEKDPVAILAYTAYTDTAQEYPNTISALNEYFTGYSLTETTASSASALQAALAGMDVFLFPEQENWTISGLGDFGSEAASVLQDFVSAGGILIATANAPTSGIQAFMDASGLIPGIGSKTNIEGNTVNTVLEHSLAADMPASFITDDYSGHYSVIPDSEPVVTYGTYDYPVAATRAIGSGMVVFLGWDYNQYADAQARLLANAVQADTMTVQIAYTLYLGDAPGALTPAVEYLRSNTYALETPLASMTTYYWQVGAENICGESLGLVWSFTTGDFLPGTPGAPSPEDGEADVWVEQNLTWESAADALCANRYDVYLGTALDALAMVAQDVYSESCATGVLESEQQYYWQVVAKNCTGSVDGPVWSFTTRTCVPDPPVNTLPGDGATGVSALPTLEWEEVLPQSGGEKDPIAILAYTAYTDIDQEYVHTLAALEEHFTAYTLTETEASSAFDLQTALTGKDVFLLPEQEDWSSSGMADFGSDVAAVLQEYTSNGGIVIACDHNGGMVELLTAAGLTTGLVEGANITDNTISAVAAHPLTEGLPATFIASNGTLYYSAFPDGTPLVTYGTYAYPVAGVKEIGAGALVVLGWDYYTYNDAQGRLLANAVQMDTDTVQIGYTVSLGEAPGEWSPIAENVRSSSYTIETPLASQTTYYWQIAATNICGETPGSVWSFTTGDFLPGVPNTPSPEDGASDLWVFQELGWACDAEPLYPNSYDVYLGTAPGALELAGQDLSAECYSTAALSPEQIYYWQIVAKNGTGNVEGPVWSFATGACQPDAPINPEPADGALDVPLFTSLSWEAAPLEKTVDTIAVFVLYGVCG